MIIKNIQANLEFFDSRNKLDPNFNYKYFINHSKIGEIYKDISGYNPYLQN